MSNHDWVSVKEKLPPYNDGCNRILVSSYSRERKMSVVSCLYYLNNRFEDGCGDEVAIDDPYWEITHWKPLPPPPEIPNE